MPSLAYAAPAHYAAATEEERAADFKLDSDFCVMRGEHFFVRAVIPVPIVGLDTTFDWGVWVTLSPANFRIYMDTFEDRRRSHLGPWFGWLGNAIEGYPDTLNLKCDVHPQDGGMRPHIQLWAAEHPLYREQRDGMTEKRLIELIESHLHE